MLPLGSSDRADVRAGRTSNRSSTSPFGVRSRRSHGRPERHTRGFCGRASSCSPRSATAMRRSRGGRVRGEDRPQVARIRTPARSSAGAHDDDAEQAISCASWRMSRRTIQASASRWSGPQHPRRLEVGDVQPPTRRALPVRLHADPPIVGQPGRDLVQHPGSSRSALRLVREEHRRGSARPPRSRPATNQVRASGARYYLDRYLETTTSTIATSRESSGSSPSSESARSSADPILRRPAGRQPPAT